MGLSLARFDELEERDLHVADWEIEQRKCPSCGCTDGSCADPDTDYYPAVKVCYWSMAREAVRRDWDAMFATADGEAKWHDGTFRNWSRERSSQFPFHRDDGVTVFAAEHDDGSWDALLGRSEKGRAESDERDDGGQEGAEQ